MLSNSQLAPEARSLFNTSYRRIVRDTDRVFAYLFIFQWILGLAFALMFSPLTWTGGVSQIHFHVYMAIFLGGALASFPAYINLTQPGEKLNRYVTAIAQMGFSALYVHLTGGRIETHFHIFGSLAFLAFYRDPGVLLLASLFTAADHFLMGAIAPLSVYGVLTSTPWRAFEHTMWVVFEDVFLIWSIRNGLGEMRSLAQKQFELRQALSGVEKIVADRTADLMLSKETIFEQQRGLVSSDQEAVGLTLVQQLVERAVAFRESKMRSAQVTCDLSLPTTRLFVGGRASELVQAIVHLIDNAIEATDGKDSRHIWLSVKRVDASIEIVIEDNGAGVTNPAKIFEPFYSTKSANHGTGLGLSIAQGSVRNHGGELSLDTASSRTRFVMRLPNALEAAQHSA